MELTLQRWNSAPRAWVVRLTQSNSHTTQLKTFKIFFCYLYVCVWLWVCAHACRFPRRLQALDISEEPQRVRGCLTWLLGTELPPLEEQQVPLTVSQLFSPQRGKRKCKRQDSRVFDRNPVREEKLGSLFLVTDPLYLVQICLWLILKTESKKSCCFPVGQ